MSVTPECAFGGDVLKSIVSALYGRQQMNSWKTIWSVWVRLEDGRLKDRASQGQQGFTED